MRRAACLSTHGDTTGHASKFLNSQRSIPAPNTTAKNAFNAGHRPRTGRRSHYEAPGSRLPPRGGRSRTPVPAGTEPRRIPGPGWARGRPHGPGDGKGRGRPAEQPHTAPSVQLPATPGRAGRKREREGGQEEGGEGAAIKPAPAKPLLAAAARPRTRTLLPGRRRRLGGARCLHLRRVAPLPTVSPLFHSRLQRRCKSSGAHIEEGKGAGKQRWSRSHTPSAAVATTTPIPGRPGRGAGSAPVTQRPWGSGRAGLQRRSPASAFMAGAGDRAEVSVPARSRRHPSLVGLIAPARHLPLPPTPPIPSPGRGEEREAGAGGARGAAAWLHAERDGERSGAGTDDGRQRSGGAGTAGGSGPAQL